MSAAPTREGLLLCCIIISTFFVLFDFVLVSELSFCGAVCIIQLALDQPVSIIVFFYASQVIASNSLTKLNALYSCYV